MASNNTSYCRCVVSFEGVIKNEKTKSDNQRYICKHCKRTRGGSYIYKLDVNENIIQFTKEDFGIRSTARVLKISITTLLKRIVSIAKNIIQPVISKGKIYEVDEMRTFVGYKHNLIWLVYALERDSKKLVSFNVGKKYKPIKQRFYL
ncbi:hypothetical protein AAEO59_04755 [Flavobacterium sp. DGU99]|uniref:Transposase n=1 Tax=Flavobacterium flavipallidum TaxID=3139140 RepID=A0ABU9HJR4_9FLAO